MIFLKKYDKYLSVLSSSKLFIVLAVLTLIPLFVISFFNNPGSDDFDFSYVTKSLSFETAQIYRYNNEGGRFFANGILSLNPLVFNNYFLYKLTPISLILLFIYSLRFFLSSFFTTISEIKKWSLIGMFLFLFFYQLPDVCSGFYWLTGAITYQLPMSLTLFYLGFLLKYYNSKKKINMVGAIICLFMTLGCSEIVTVIFIFLHGFVFAYIYFKHKTINNLFFFLLIIIISFSSIILLAPGNAVRGELIIVKHLFIYSSIRTFLFSISFIFKWIPIILICCLFFSKNIYSFIDSLKNKNVFINPILALALLFSFLCISIFPGFWSLNLLLPDRTLNTIYFFFIFIGTYTIITTFYFLKVNYNFVIELPISSKIILGCFFIFSTFSSTPIFTTYFDLLTGKAYKYNQEIEKRFDLIQSSKEETVVLPALINKPKTIYNQEIMGITTDKENWKNLELSKFYGKIIIVQPTDSYLTE